MCGNKQNRLDATKQGDMQGRVKITGVDNVASLNAGNAVTAQMKIAAGSDWSLDCN